MNQRALGKRLRRLSHHWPVFTKGPRHFIVRGFLLPPGYNRQAIDVWTEIPRDYPEGPPGVAPAHVYLPAGLRFQGRTPKDYHEGRGPRGWAWWCYQGVGWDPCRDDLVRFFALLRAHMTNPT